MIAILLLVLTFDYVPWHAQGLLLQNIKVDLSLSDAQLGILSGIAFALFYSVLGIPLARLADRGNRVKIIAVSAVLCGIALALCGIVGSFTQLLFARIGVAVGEAGCIPPAHSLIAESFDRSERTRAFSIYQLGVPLSTLLATAAAGWLNELYGWRTTFILLGLPGIPLGLLAWLTLREPDRRGGAAALKRQADEPRAQSFWHVCGVLWRNVTFRNVLFGYSIGAFASLGINQWSATFFRRSYGLETGELGMWLASIWGFGGLLGVYLSGVLVSRYADCNERLQLRGVALAQAFFGVMSVGVYAAPTPHLAFIFMALGVVVVFLSQAPLFAVIQTIVPNDTRAMSIALIFLLSNLVGVGFGPLAVGIVSDALRHWAGNESLRYAILALSPGSTVAGWFFWRASKSVTRDVERTEQDPENGSQVQVELGTLIDTPTRPLRVK
jgi:MFS family permease